MTNGCSIYLAEAKDVLSGLFSSQLAPTACEYLCADFLKECVSAMVLSSGDNNDIIEWITTHPWVSLCVCVCVCVCV